MTQRLDPVTGNFARRVLGLSEEQVRRRATAAQACSSYHRTAPGDELRAASQAILVASCWVLIDTVASQNYWQAAADRYARFHHPYAALLSICAGSVSYGGPFGARQSPLALQCRLMQLAWLSVTAPHGIPTYREELEDLRELTERFGALVTGQLALPVWYAAELARTLSDEPQDLEVSSSVGGAIQRLLRRAGDTVRGAQGDRYHWQRIMPGFMPVEPEWLAIGRIGYQAITATATDYAMVTEGLTNLELLPLRLAAGMPPAPEASVRPHPAPAPAGTGDEARPLAEGEADRFTL